MNVGFKVYSKPYIGRRVEFKLFDHELLGAGADGPMYSVHGVAGEVITDTSRVRRGVMGATLGLRAAGKFTLDQAERGERHGRRVDQQFIHLVEDAADAEEAEGVAALDGGRSQVIQTPVGAARAHPPALIPFSLQGDYGSDVVPGQRGSVAHLQPQFWQPRGVLYLDYLLHNLAHLRLRWLELSANGKPALVKLRPDEGSNQHGSQHIRQIIKQVQTYRHGGNIYRHCEKGKTYSVGVFGHGCVSFPAG